MSPNLCPQLKVLLVGDHDTGKTRYLISLLENRLPPENTQTPRVADSFTLTLTIPGASPLEDPSAWRGWLDSNGRKAGDARKSEGQYTLSTKKEAIIAPWDTFASLNPNDRLHSLAYPDTHAIALCFSVVDRGSFRNIQDRWYPEITYFLPNVPIVLFGMKSDLRNSGVHVSPEEGHTLANSLGAAAYVECSSKSDMRSVHTSFQMLSWLALGRFDGSRAGRNGRRRQCLREGCVIA